MSSERKEELVATACVVLISAAVVAFWLWIL